MRERNTKQDGGKDKLRITERNKEVKTEGRKDKKKQREEKIKSKVNQKFSQDS